MTELLLLLIVLLAAPLIPESEKTKKQKRKFVKFTERNDNEGETWFFFLPVNNDEEHAHYKVFSKAIELDEEETYSIELENLVSENEVDILVKHSPEGYMDTFNKIEGRMKQTEFKDICERLSNEDSFEEAMDELYKGGIKRFFG